MAISLIVFTDFWAVPIDLQTGQESSRLFILRGDRPGGPVWIIAGLAGFIR